MNLSKDLTAAMDILNAVNNIAIFTKNYNLESFSSDQKTLYAVLHQFLIIGEASKRVSEGFKAKHTDIEWSKMAKMRDKLIHHYTNVDAVLIWETVRKEIPKLKKSVEHLLKNY